MTRESALLDIPYHYLILLETSDDFIYFIQHSISFARDGRDDGLTCVITIYSLCRFSRIGRLRYRHCTRWLLLRILSGLFIIPTFSAPLPDIEIRGYERSPETRPPARDTVLSIRPFGAIVRDADTLVTIPIDPRDFSTPPVHTHPRLRQRPRLLQRPPLEYVKVVHRPQVFEPLIPLTTIK